ncbi:MAG: PEP-CTERM sorting domain-containing protein [Planctomycetales bacterium]
MKTQLGWAIAAVLAVIAGHGRAEAGLLYFADNLDNVRTVDPGTTPFTVTTVGSLGVDFQYSGLDQDPNTNTIYGVAGHSGTGLYTIDPTTGAASLVGSHGVTDLFGLAFDSKNNVLYGTQISSTGQLYQLNTTTGAATAVGPLSGALGIGGLAYDALRDMLVGWYDFGGDLYAIDRTTGAATLLVDGPAARDGGLAYDADRDVIWGVDLTNSGTLFSLDPNNGYARTNHLTGLGGSPTGLAYINAPNPNSILNNPPNPDPPPALRTPEPTSLAAFGVAGVVMALSAARRRRRRRAG